MSRDLDIRGEVLLEWGPHHYRVRGEGDSLTIQPLNRWGGTLRLLLWRMMSTPPAFQKAIVALKRCGIRVRVRFR